MSMPKQWVGHSISGFSTEKILMIYTPWKPPCFSPFTKADQISDWGWLGGAMVLGKLPVLGRPTLWMIVGQGPIALAVGAGGSCLDIFTLLYLSSSLSP